MLTLLLAIIYLAFISLGLPDSLLGSAWPLMHQELGVALSNAGIISMIIAGGTIISSLQSEHFTKLLGTGKVTAISVALTAIALLGFSISNSFWMLCLWAIPYGLGAGSVDASLNHYVAVHYASRHMSWLHCMWGVGATIGPYIMGYVLQSGLNWTLGYRLVGYLQLILVCILVFSLRLWNKHADKTNVEEEKDKVVTAATKPLKIVEVISLPGAKAIIISFFCYCALEQTTSLWASSYLVYFRGISSEVAAGFASMFFIGITFGRAISGFLTMVFRDDQMIRGGLLIIASGIICLFLANHEIMALVGLVLIGLGCAPIYPCIIHSTPAIFGADQAQAMIGVQMASAYVGTMIMPVLFGFLAKFFHVSLFPWYLMALLLFMMAMYSRLLKQTSNNAQ